MNKKIKNASKISSDGIDFDSNIELYCYCKLRDAGLAFKYNSIKYTLIDKFSTSYDCYESIGKIKRDENKKILSSTKRFDTSNSIRELAYTPDFVSDDNSWIIETKGFANDSFPLRWKMFKMRLEESGYTGCIFKLQNKKEVDLAVDIIKNRYINNCNEDNKNKKQQ